MAVLTLRRPSLIALVALLIFLLIALSFTSYSPVSFGDYRDLPKPFSVASPQTAAQPSDGWTYSYRRDWQNYGLTEEQCEAAFPSYGGEIDGAAAYRRGNKIKESDIETGWRGDGIVRAMIWDNQLYITQSHAVWDYNHRPRMLAALNNLHRAISSSPTQDLPNIEFTITVHDSAEFHGLDPDPEHPQEHTTWALARLPHQKSLWLMPDFGLWAWPNAGMNSWQELQRKILDTEEGLRFEDKIPRLVWRGQTTVAAADVRSQLISAANESSWSDVKPIDWTNSTDVEDKRLSMEDFCRFQFAAMTEGNTYSGRMKIIQSCRTVVVSHKLSWIEPWHHLLRRAGPAQNYVEVERDFSDLESKITALLKDPEKAKRIADNSVSAFRERYFTPAATACYWRHMIRKYAEVQGFEPNLFTEVENWDNVAKKNRLVKKPKGVPFESWVIMESTQWDVPPRPRRVCEYVLGGSWDVGTCGNSLAE